VFLNEKECAKISEVFFEEISESKKRLNEQFNENFVNSPRSSTVFSVFLQNDLL